MTSPRDGTLVRVRVTPRAARDEILGWRDGRVLGVRVAAPPVEGEANRAVAALIARALRIPKTGVTVVRGERGRDKLVHVAGLALADIDARLAAAQGPVSPGPR
jgi:uncharacterized protein